MGRFESAVAMCRRQSAGDPDNPYCVMALAQALARLGQSAEAMAHMEKAMELEPGNGALTLERARVLAILEQWEPAMAAIGESLTQPMGPSEYEIRLDPHFSELEKAGRLQTLISTPD